MIGGAGPGVRQVRAPAGAYAGGRLTSSNGISNNQNGIDTTNTSTTPSPASLLTSSSTQHASNGNGSDGLDTGRPTTRRRLVRRPLDRGRRRIATMVLDWSWHAVANVDASGMGIGSGRNSPEHGDNAAIDDGDDDEEEDDGGDGVDAVYAHARSELRGDGVGDGRHLHRRRGGAAHASELNGGNNRYASSSPPPPSSYESSSSSSLHLEDYPSSYPLPAPIYTKTLALLTLFRIANAVAVRTYFDPDEFWQGPEVAHEVVFGYGYLTWEWSFRIRGFAHPMLFAAVYRVLHAAGLGDSYLLILAPRIVQGCFAALADCYTFMLALRMFGPRTAKWTAAAMLMSWFNYYCLVRTYSNSLEACLNAVALYYWPWPRRLGEPRPHRRQYRIALVIAAMSCIVRPTAMILWMFLGMSLVLRAGKSTMAVLHDAVMVAIGSIIACMILDRQFYRSWVFVPWEFLRLNVIHNIAQFYGQHPFHWYFTQGLPVVLLTFLPLSVYGARYVNDGAMRRHCFWACVGTVCVLSMQSHKEFRFLMPIVPPMLMYAGHGLHLVERADAAAGRRGWRGWLAWMVLGLAITNGIVGLYLSRVHQRGVVDVMDWLRLEMHRNNNKTSDTNASSSHQHVSDVLFLMPCHSTPYYSAVHHNVPMRFVSCEPPLRGDAIGGVRNSIGNTGTSIPAYRDETDVLYSDPAAFFRRYFSFQVGNKTMDWGTKPDSDHDASPPMSVTKPASSQRRSPSQSDMHVTVDTRQGRAHDADRSIPVPGQSYTIQQYTWASHIVMFDNHKLMPFVRVVFDKSDYHECARFFNSHFHDDAKRVGDVVVFCRRPHV